MGKLLKFGKTLSLGRAPQPESWLRYRRPFEGFDDLQKVMDWLRHLEKPPYICVFLGRPKHWYWSLRYSLEGERGYALWGVQVPWSDKAEEAEKGKGLDKLSYFPSSNLVGTYEDGHFVVVRNAIQSLNADRADVRPLVGLFYAIDPISQYLGFGLVTDFSLDAYRNFGRDGDYWDESEGAWVLRWRMRVLWLDRDVVDPLLKASDPEDFEKELTGRALTLTERLRSLKDKLGPRANMCFKDEGLLSQAWDILRRIINNDNEAKRMISFYSEVVQSPPNVRVPGPAVKREGCTPRALDASSYNKAMDEVMKEVRKELYLDDDTARKFAVAALAGNVLLYGPPGTGKTSLAVRFAEALTGCRPVVKVANALWFRRDVIGGETLEGGNVKWRSGFIIEAYNWAAGALRKPGDNRDFLVFVVLDELNRADVDKAFGDFFAMFPSPHPEDWHVPESLISEIESYGERADDEAKEFVNNYRDLKDEPLKHVRIIATMNVVDVRNLFMVGEALSRRFTVVEIPCPGEAKEGAKDVEFLLNRLNKRALIRDLPDFGERVTDLIKCLRRKLGGEEESKGKLCVSPAAVRSALELLANSYDLGLVGRDTDTVIETFKDYLRSSMGLLISGEEELKEAMKKCPERPEGTARA
ncbi:MAG: AAA family ATPase [Acidilobus sp.]